MTNANEHLREAARRWRLEGMSLDLISQRLNTPRGTVYYWIKDVPLDPSLTTKGRPRALRPVHSTEFYFEMGEKKMAKAKEKRDLAYDQGVEEFPTLMQQDPTFRDFVMLYLTEGYRRTRHKVNISNSNPKLILLGYRWINSLARGKAMRLRVQVHADQDPQEVQSFWGQVLSQPPEKIGVTRKSNSSKLGGRVWRSKYGVISIEVQDTYLRARLEAWMNCLQESWQFNVPGDEKVVAKDWDSGYTKSRRAAVD